jgi:23S rRNA pseudouridine955/2504/2580 synthase
LQNKNIKIYKVTSNYIDQRLDNFLLRNLKSVPKSLIYRLLRQGHIRVNKKRAKQVYRMQEGDEVQVPDLRMREEKKVEVAASFVDKIRENILYEDKYLLVINKPAGIASHAGSGISVGVIEALKKSMQQEDDFLELIHRLDRGTSGCLVMAKKSSVLKELNKMLADGEVKKTYHAIVKGRWPKSCHKVDLPLYKKESGANGIRQVFVDKINGKSALTTVGVLNNFGSAASLLSLHPKTGRTHQLRVHTSYNGHPILGDEKYGVLETKSRSSVNLNLPKACRMFLHAYQISFKHPITDEQVIIKAPYDKKMLDFIDMLKSK